MNTPDIVLHVSFKGVSTGKTTARIGFTVDRDHEGFGIEDAERLFLDSRVEALMVIDPDQQRLTGVEDDSLASVADVKGYRATSDAISAALTFALTEIDVAELSQFGYRNCKLSLKRIGSASEVADAHDEEVGEVEDQMDLDDQQDDIQDDARDDVEEETIAAADTAASEALEDIDGSTIRSWRDYPISSLELTDKAEKSISAEHNTVGELVDAGGNDLVAWLCKFEGIGKTKAVKIAQAVSALQDEHPSMDSQDATLGIHSAADLAAEPPAPEPLHNEPERWQDRSLHGLIADAIVEVWTDAGGKPTVGTFHDWVKKNSAEACVRFFANRGLMEQMARAAISKIDDFVLQQTAA